MNKDVIQHFYWAKSALPKLQINDETLNGYNVDELWGLRLVVEVCDGKHCNNKGDDDISHPVESDRIQNCYNEDDQNGEDLCLDCRNAGLAAGGLLTFSLIFITTAISLSAVRFTEKQDNIVTKYAGIILHFAVLLLTFLTLAIYGAHCYESLQKNLYAGDHDDYIDNDEIDFSLGPGFILLTVAMLLQPMTMFFLFLAKVGGDGDGIEGGEGSGVAMSQQEVRNENIWPPLEAKEDA